MKILVLLKLVPDLVEDLEVDDSGTALDAEYIKLKLNEFDDHALEEALLLKESDGAEVVAMAVDSEDADKLLFTALAKGADRAIKLIGAEPRDSHQLARIFANAIPGEGFDLIMTGVQSVDDRDGQLGPILATYLGIPCMSVVTGVQLSGRSITINKEYSGGLMAEFEVDTPAVLGVQAARQTPRYVPVSKIRQIQQTTSIETMDAGDPGPGAGTGISSMSRPEKGAGAKMLNSVDELLEVLKQVGVG